MQQNGITLDALDLMKIIHFANEENEGTGAPSHPFKKKSERIKKYSLKPF